MWSKVIDHSKDFFKRWSKSAEGCHTRDDLLEDAVFEFQDALDEYREELSIALAQGESLIRPVKPGMAEFTLVSETVDTNEQSTDNRDVDTVNFEDESDGIVGG